MIGLTPRLTSAGSGTSPEVLVSVASIGGMCSYGQCHSTLMIYADGTGRLQEGPQETPVRDKSFALEPQDFAELRRAIQGTDFDRLRATQFTGTCPTAYDGSQFIYTISTRGGEVRLDSCAQVIEPEAALFKLLQALRVAAYSASDQ